jgi:trans-aconitate 2-methyltransferase
VPAPATQWNAAAYAANSAVQQAWARELIAALRLRGDEHVLDVGCGDGKVTAEIAQALPRGAATGVDASPQMIAFARQTFPRNQHPNLAFHLCDARKLKDIPFNSPAHSEAARMPSGVQASSLSRPTGEGRGEGQASGSERVTAGVRAERVSAGGEGGCLSQFDLLFSNAALHWVDDHQAFLRGAAAVLKPGGRLLVSCGGQGNAQDVFVALRPEMRRQRWRAFFRRMPTPYFFHAPADYETWLRKFDFKVSSLQLAPKDALYAGAEGFATWLRTTWLPYTQCVPEPLREEFIAAVTARYVAQHPPDAAGRVHVRMVRLEIDAVKL